MKTFLLIVAFVIGTGAASASGIENEQDWVIDCLSRMEVSTTWDECRTGMFQMCQTDTVGTPEHLSCLTEQSDKWKVYLQDYTDLLNEKLTSDGALELSRLLGQWFGFVGNKCAAVAESKADISAEAAGLGCEISEFAGLVTEFHACLDQRSTAPYCDIKE